MQWVATFVDSTSGPANAASSSVLGFAKNLLGASNASAKLDASTATSATRMRGLHGELGKAQAELARYEAAAKTMQGGTSVNVADWKNLQAEITKSKARVTDLNSQIVKGGGAGFDTKAFDDKQKKSQDDRSASMAKGASRNAAILKGVGTAASAAIGASFAAGAIGLAAFVSVGQRALSSQIGAQARLNAITARYNQGLRDISKNANLTPFLNSADKLAAMFDKNTATGKFMGVQVKRAFDAVGGAVTAITPYAEKAFAKMLLASLRVEIGFWKVVGAGAKIGTTIAKSLSSSPSTLDAIRSASEEVRTAIDATRQAVNDVGSAFGAASGNATILSAALGAVKLYVSVLSIEIGALAGFVSGVMGTVSGLATLLKGVFTGDTTMAVNGFKQLVTSAFSAMASSVFGFAKIAATAVDAIAGTDYAGKLKGVESSLKAQLASWGTPTPANKTNGEAVGSDIGAGIVAGINAQTPAITAAGAGAAGAALKGAKTEAKIASPSKAAEDEVGAMLGAGVQKGIRKSAGAIQSEAEQSLIPNFAGIGGDASSASGGSASLARKAIQFVNCVFNGTQTEADLESMLIRIMARQLSTSDIEASP